MLLSSLNLLIIIIYNCLLLSFIAVYYYYVCLLLLFIIVYYYYLSLFITIMYVDYYYLLLFVIVVFLVTLLRSCQLTHSRDRCMPAML